jgi:hypothetical protein
MTSPPLYKYLDVQGARLTLANRCFRHAKPSELNDTEELTIRSLFPEDDQTALDQIESNFTDVLVKHIEQTPTCISDLMRQKIAVLQAVFKTNPAAADIIKEAKKDLPSVFNLEHMKQRHQDFVAEINSFMQGFRVLCVSSSKDSDLMWCRYAEDHHGIVLKISPNVEKDSKYKLFRPVSYYPTRPALYDSALSFQEESLFGDQEARIKAAMEKISCQCARAVSLGMEPRAFSSNRIWQP